MARIISFICLLLAACSDPALELKRLEIKDIALDPAEVSEALVVFRQACPAITLKTPALREACQDLESEFPANPLAFLDAYFIAQEVQRGRAGGGFFTGYFEIELAASSSSTPGYETPIYALPPDLVAVELGDFRPDLKGRRVAGRVKNGRLVPYADRAGISAGALDGGAEIIAWAADPVELFFLHIQGSGILRFPDGSARRIGYAGQNGHVYTAIGRPLIERGEIAAEDMSLEAIASWLRANPNEAQALMNENASYVFFADKGEDGPFGALGVPLQAERAIAVDPLHTPYGALVFVETQLADASHFSKLLLAADTGGAIRGLGRGDIFFGAGPAARSKASALKAPGRFVMFVPKPFQS